MPPFPSASVSCDSNAVKDEKGGDRREDITVEDASKSGDISPIAGSMSNLTEVIIVLKAS